MKTPVSITQEYLKSVLHYDPDTGIFTWKITPNKNRKIVAGDIAGSPNSDGYLQIKIDNKLRSAHRLAWFYMEGYFPENEIDHKDKVRDNNRWNNLRESTRLCNQRNCKIRKDNTSQVTGVRWYRKQWHSRIGLNNKKIYLGRFDNFIDAVKARWEGKKNWGSQTVKLQVHRICI